MSITSGASSWAFCNVDSPDMIVALIVARVHDSGSSQALDHRGQRGSAWSFVRSGVGGACTSFLLATCSPARWARDRPAFSSDAGRQTRQDAPIVVGSRTASAAGGAFFGASERSESTSSRATPRLVVEEFPVDHHQCVIAVWRIFDVALRDHTVGGGFLSWPTPRCS